MGARTCFFVLFSFCVEGGCVNTRGGGVWRAFTHRVERDRVTFWRAPKWDEAIGEGGEGEMCIAWGLRSDRTRRRLEDGRP